MTTTIPQFDLHDRIRKARETLGINQGQFAERLRVSGTTISRWESGTSRPSWPTLLTIADETNVDVDWLAGDAYDRPRRPPTQADRTSPCIINGVDPPGPSRDLRDLRLAA